MAGINSCRHPLHASGQTALIKANLCPGLLGANELFFQSSELNFSPFSPCPHLVIGRPLGASRGFYVNHLVTFKLYLVKNIAFGSLQLKLCVASTCK